MFCLNNHCDVCFRLPVKALHGDKSQTERDYVLRGEKVNWSGKILM